MVPRIVKRTPTKCIRDCRRIGSHGHCRPRRSPIKGCVPSSVSSVLASINKSLRRIFKFFSKLARITTPNSSLCKKGFKILSKLSDENEVATAAAPRRLASTCKVLAFEDVSALPSLDSPTKKTIFLDLDETLIHSKSDPPPEKFDFIVRPTINGERLNFYVLKRPGVDKFLQAISERFEVVIFTADLKEYASLILDRLDPTGAMVSYRLYRDSCREMEGKFVKDLSGMGRDLKRVVIVDDNPNAYGFQPENALPISPFIDDLKDVELGKLIKFFEECEEFDDMREAVRLYSLLEGEDHRKLLL
ncbi:hypothetical protein SAY87_031272 [Trapa incisa]|uniref:FCP1 homology domain-containing protein n=1 Tax=Trapa incisa TaxID=236973 RepID=A0AAN7KVR3_9MYRT|nr:hypothetical protein SAY87_031272 [Trapa incisa]